MGFINIIPSVNLFLSIALFVVGLVFLLFLGFQVYRFTRSRGSLLLFWRSVRSFKNFTRLKDDTHLSHIFAYIGVFSLVIVSIFSISLLVSSYFLLPATLEVPQFSITSGVLSSDVPQPYIAGSDGFSFVLDTVTNQSVLDEKYGGSNGMLLWRGGFKTLRDRSGLVEQRSFEFTPEINFNFDEAFVSSVVPYVTFFTLFFYPLFILLVFVYFLVYILLASLVGLLIALIMGIRLRFEQVFALGTLVFVPLESISLILGNFVSIPAFLFSFVYLVVLGVVMKTSLVHHSLPVSRGKR